MPFRDPTRLRFSKDKKHSLSLSPGFPSRKRKSISSKPPHRPPSEAPTNPLGAAPNAQIITTNSNRTEGEAGDAAILLKVRPQTAETLVLK